MPSGLGVLYGDLKSCADNYHLIAYASLNSCHWEYCHAMGFFRRYNVSSLRVYGEEKSCGVSFLRISDPNRIARFIFRMVFELWQTVFRKTF
jgi:hypothetical protein